MSPIQSEMERELRKLSRTAESERSDAELLERFALTRDEQAFAALMDRHGRLVLNVCRRTLRQQQDAEDAFQATFLVLARRSESIRKHTALASWLYAVAHRIAMKMQKKITARRGPEVGASARHSLPPAAEAAWRELQVLLEEELAHLPEARRLAFVLCCLEGNSKGQAARVLGWKEGTVASRVAQARKQLQRRLARRGVKLSTVLCGTALTQQTSSVPASLAAATRQAAADFAAGTLARSASTQALITARTLLRSALVKKMLMVGALLVTAGTGAFAWQALQRPSMGDGQGELVFAGESGSGGASGMKHAGETSRVDQHGDPLPPGARARLGTIRFRSGLRPVSAVLSPDGKLIATTEHGYVANLVDSVSGLVVREIQSLTLGGAGAAFSPDGRLLALTDMLGGIQLYEVASGRLVRTLEGTPRAALQITPVFSADGRVLTESVDGLPVPTDPYEIFLWEVASGKQIAKVMPSRNGRVHAALSSDGKTLATCGSTKFPPSAQLNEGRGAQASENAVQLWNVESGKELRRFEIKTSDGIADVAFAPGDKTIAIAEYAGPALLVDAVTGERLQQFRGLPPWRHGVNPMLKFSPDGKRLAVAGDAMTVWDTTTGKQLLTQQPFAEHVCSVVFPRDRVLASGVFAHTIRVWDSASGRVRGPTGGHAEALCSLAFAADQRTLASADRYGNVLRWEEALSGQFAGPVPAGTGSEWGKGAVLGGRGKYAVLPPADIGGWPRLRNLQSGRDLREYQFWRIAPLCASFSSDGKLVAIGGADMQAATSVGTPGPQGGKDAASDAGNFQTQDDVELYSVDNGNLIRRFKGYKGDVHAIALSPDRRLVAAIATPFEKVGIVDLELCVWEIASGKQLAKISTSCMFPRMAGQSVAFSPDSTLLASVEETGAVCVREAVTGKKLCVLAGGDPSPGALSFSPDGRMIAVAAGARFDSPFPRGRHSSGTVELWELSSGSIRREFTGHAGEITALAFSDDGRLLASGSADTTVLVWDVDEPKARAASGSGLSERDAESLWRELGSTSASQGYQAILRLSAAPADAVGLIRKKMRPVPPVPEESELRRLALQLDSHRFAEREAAAVKLVEAGKAAVPIVEELLRRGPSGELKQRLTKVVQEVTGLRRWVCEARASRALEVLERLKTPEARELLQRFAQGRLDAPLTREAKAALARLETAR